MQKSTKMNYNDLYNQYALIKNDGEGRIKKIKKGKGKMKDDSQVHRSKKECCALQYMIRMLPSQKTHTCLFVRTLNSIKAQFQ